MKIIFSKRHIVFFLLSFFLLIHLPSIFGKSSGNKWNNLLRHNYSFALYQSLRLDSLGLSSEAFHMAVTGFQKLKEGGKFAEKSVISIIDMSKPSTEKRLYIIDMDKSELLFHTYVSHGMRSGKLFAEKFSNSPRSNQTSLGFYETLTTYNGKHGYSLHLNGLERGINDRANARAIVVHGAAYVSEGMIRLQGYLGRSFGCPAIPEKLSKPIIDQIKDGSCLFIYAADRNYLLHSSIVNS